MIRCLMAKAAAFASPSHLLGALLFSLKRLLIQDTFSTFMQGIMEEEMIMSNGFPRNSWRPCSSLLSFPPSSPFLYDSTSPERELSLIVATWPSHQMYCTYRSCFPPWPNSNAIAVPYRLECSVGVIQETLISLHSIVDKKKRQGVLYSIPVPTNSMPPRLNIAETDQVIPAVFSSHVSTLDAGR